MDGRARSTPAGWVLCFARHLFEPPEDVWPLLVEPEGLRRWLAPARLEPVAGGELTLSPTPGQAPVRGRLVRLEKASLLEHTLHGLGEDARLRWRLVAVPRGSRLRLTLAVPAGSDPTAALARWHLRLDLLMVSMEVGRAVWLPDRYERLRRHYTVVRALVRGGAGGRAEGGGGRGRGQ